tara:strand:+ start:226 stop:612 length:387 start_codon:yes stop_codon:yes gene_type:complete
MIQDKYIKLVADSSVTINTVSVGSTPPGGTVNLTVENTNGDQIGLAATDWVIADTEISINGVITFYSYAESSIDIPVINTDGTAIGAINGLSQFEIPDNTYEVFVDGVSQGSATGASVKDQIININWV